MYNEDERWYINNNNSNDIKELLCITDTDSLLKPKCQKVPILVLKSFNPSYGTCAELLIPRQHKIKGYCTTQVAELISGTGV